MVAGGIPATEVEGVISNGTPVCVTFHDGAIALGEYDMDNTGAGLYGFVSITNPQTVLPGAKSYFLCIPDKITPLSEISAEGIMDKIICLPGEIRSNLAKLRIIALYRTELVSTEFQSFLEELIKLF
ncbi:hypothetical protein HYV12_03245 [Candidatus Dojkabacteria bacterium]|nr:hypothetical protein [Candidatus Dojkabacteria bacterium]